MQHYRGLMAAAVVAGLCVQAGGLAAQPMGPSGMRGGRAGGMMHGGQIANSAQYLDSLKARLGITAAQEAAWTTYAEVVKGAAAQMQGAHQTMYDAMGTATWQERRDMMNRMFEAREQARTQVHAAAEALLPSLTAAQRETAAGALPGLMGRGPMGPRGGPMR